MSHHKTASLICAAKVALRASHIVVVVMIIIIITIIIMRAHKPLRMRAVRIKSALPAPAVCGAAVDGGDEAKTRMNRNDKYNGSDREYGLPVCVVRPAIWRRGG